MPSPRAPHTHPLNGLIPALQVINTGGKDEMKHFPFRLDGEVCRLGDKLCTSWKPDL